MMCMKQFMETHSNSYHIINNKQIEYNIKGIYNISKPKQTEGKLDSKQSKFCD